MSTDLKNEIVEVARGYLGITEKPGNRGWNNEEFE